VGGNLLPPEQCGEPFRWEIDSAGVEISSGVDLYLKILLDGYVDAYDAIMKSEAEKEEVLPLSGLKLGLGNQPLDDLPCIALKLNSPDDNFQAN